MIWDKFFLVQKPMSDLTISTDDKFRDLSPDSLLKSVRISYVFVQGRNTLCSEYYTMDLANCRIISQTSVLDSASLKYQLLSRLPSILNALPQPYVPEMDEYLQPQFILTYAERSDTFYTYTPPSVLIPCYTRDSIRFW